MPLKNILQSGICYTVIIITASLTSCQAKQAKELIFTIFLLSKFLLSPHSINFQFYLSMSVLFFLLNSFLHSLLQWFSYDFFVQDTWTLALPHYSQRIPLPRVSLAELKPSDRTLSPSCLHLLFSCSSGRIYFLQVRRKLLHVCPGTHLLLFIWLPFYTVLFNFLYPIILYIISIFPSPVPFN